MFLRRFARDVAAVAAVEFAFIAPILVVMYFGLADLTEGFIAQRRVAHAGSAVGDLVAQSSAITASQVADIFTAGQLIVAPFPTAPLEQRVTSITADANDNQTVTWSQASGGMSPMTAGASVTLPPGTVSANESVVMSEVEYVYTSSIGESFKAPITFANTYYFHPRLSAQVTCADCS